MDGVRMTRAPDRLAEDLRGHPGDRLFACRIDVGDDQEIGIAEGRQKLVKRACVRV